MGCNGSKQTRQDHRLATCVDVVPCSHRYSVTINADGGSHVVTLTSSTLGSLRLEYRCSTSNINNNPTITIAAIADTGEPPQMVTYPNVPETINAWELMEGLNDEEFFTSVIDNAANSSVVSALEPEILSSFPEQETIIQTCSSPSKNQRISSLLQDSPKSTTGSSVRARIKAFQQKIHAKSAKTNCNIANKKPASPANKKDKVVLYYTSLRGVRKTFEDCWAVKAILKSYGFVVDERDVSIHSEFKEELIRTGFGIDMQLPKIFAGSRFLGGADEVRHLHETGKLVKALQGCEMMVQCVGGKGSDQLGCQACGDIRFVLCDMCCGSCKLFDDEEEKTVQFGGFRRCPHCNENGLVRCPLCC